MTTAEENGQLTQVGPGTAMGELLRRYWHPVATVQELAGRTAIKVRVFSEDLIMYRDQSGTYGLLEENCPHRRCSFLLGIPESNGLRCAYHGWVFNEAGRCLEQPAESEHSRFKEQVRAKAYPVQEMGGLLFAYMGPLPAPVLPRFDYYAQPNAIRQIGITKLPVNWLQVMENSLDPVHAEWLHAYYNSYRKTGETFSSLGYFPQKRHIKVDFELFEFGITKRRIYEGGSEEDPEWKIGHPIIFPNFLKQGYTYQIRVPIDEENTLLYWYDSYSVDGVELEEQGSVPIYDYPYLDDEGNLLTDDIRQQDMAVWLTQGKISDRENEHMAGSDRGVAMFRDLLFQQLDLVASGSDPLGVIRDPSRTDVIYLTSDHARIPRPSTLQEKGQPLDGALERELRNRYAGNPMMEEIVQLFLKEEQLEQHRNEVPVPSVK
jgi:5,5'-dehydrodivanillate O-demethylase